MKPHDFWQRIDPPQSSAPEQSYADGYPAEFGDGRRLLLPIRPLADGEQALASLIINQASFEVVDALAASLAEKLAAFRPDIVVGLPTLGLTLASAVAQKLGHRRYVPLGASRKFWYQEALSVPLSSITSSEQQKRLYVDPRMLSLLSQSRVALVDDVISTGTSISAGLRLLAVCGVEPVVIGAAMLQSDRWKHGPNAIGPAWVERTIGVLRSPILKRTSDGRWRDSEGR